MFKVEYANDDFVNNICSRFIGKILFRLSGKENYLSEEDKDGKLANTLKY